MSQPFSAADIRRYTFRAGLARTEGGLMDIIAEIYTAILGALTLLTMAGALVVALRHSLGVEAESALSAVAVAPGFHSVSLVQASATLLLTLAAALLTVEMRMGPVAMTLPQTAWWLGLPVRRRGFIQPGFLRSIVWPSIAAVMVALPLALGAAASPAPGDIASSVLCALGLVWLLFGVAAWCQMTGSGGRLRKLTGAVMVLAPLSLVVTAMLNTFGLSVQPAQTAWLAYLPTSWPLLVADGVSWPLLSVALALGLLALVFSRLERIPTAALKQSAATGAYAASSLLSMDGTELARSLGGAPAGSGSSRVRLPLLYHRGSARTRTVKTLLATHTTLALRTPGALVRIFVLASIPASFAAIEFLGNAVLLAAAVFLCSHFAAIAVGGTARFAAGNPAVDLLLPLPARTVRRVHWVVPAALMSLWLLLTFGLLATLGVGSGALLLLAAAAGPGLGAASIRAAFRPAPDWNMPAVATPTGPIPAGAIRAMLVGPDLSLLVLLPVLICLVSGGVPLLAVVIQIAVSALAFLWGTRVRRN